MSDIKFHGIIPDNARRLLIFDFDGTLLDSTLREFERIKIVLETLELRLVSPDFIRSLWGEPIRDIYRKIGLAVGATEEQIGMFMRIEENIDPGYSLNPLILDVLYSLRGRGYPSALLTNRSARPLTEVMDQIGFDRNVFNFIQTYDDYEYHKPDGRVFEPLVSLAQRNNIRRITYFGDTLKHDYRAAADCEHPIDFVGVASGINTVEDFRRAGVDHVVNGVDDLPRFLTAYFN